MTRLEKLEIQLLNLNNKAVGLFMAAVAFLLAFFVSYHRLLEGNNGMEMFFYWESALGELYSAFLAIVGFIDYNAKPLWDLFWTLIGRALFQR